MAEADVPPPPVLSVPAKRNPASAIWSLILGILSVVCAGVFAAVPAVICGHVARAAIRNSRGELGGEGLALAGLILGYAAIVLNIILVPTIVVPVLQKKFAESNGVTGFNNAIVSADGMERILAPANWKSLSGLNKDASIAAGNESQEEYLVVISENKADLADSTLERHHQLTRDRTIGTLKNGSATPASSLTIDGHPALQDEISGVWDNNNVVLLHTTIDQGKYVYQIQAWAPKSRWEFKKPRLQEVTLSFRSSH